MDHVRYVGGLLHPQRGATITLADEASRQCYFDEMINAICMRRYHYYYQSVMS